LVQERHNARIVTEAILLQQVVQSVFSKKAGREFSKNIKQLNVETSLHKGQFE